MSEKVIEVHNLVKRYGKILAVNKISFDVYRGEIFSLVGPNGAGKTTTVEILECLRTPTSGSARVLGFDVMREEQKIKTRIGVMPQQFNTFHRLSVKENVELITKIYRKRTDVKHVLNTVGLWEERNKKYQYLSGGMQRRVGIAMALVSEPEILFLDEPTTGLDPYARRETWEVIRAVKKTGVTIFLTSHYMEEVEKLSDRAGVIIKGRMVALDDIRALITRYGGGIKVAVSGARAIDIMSQFTKDVWSTDAGVMARFEDRFAASRALAQLYQHGEYRIEVIEPGMDDVFFALSGARLDDRGELMR